MHRASEANGIMSSLVSAAEAWYQANGSFTGFDTSAQWTNITGRSRYFTFASTLAGNGGYIQAAGTGTSPDPTTADTLRATMGDMSLANEWGWTAAGYCTASV